MYLHIFRLLLCGWVEPEEPDPAAEAAAVGGGAEAGETAAGGGAEAGEAAAGLGAEAGAQQEEV